MTAANNHPEWMKRVGATPGKLALIGVLAAILGYVVLSQLPSGGSSSAESAPSSPRLPRSAAKANSNKSKTPVAERQAWPKPNLEQAVASDPFARPQWAQVAQAEPAETAASDRPMTAQAAESQALAKLRAEGAAVIVVLDGKPLALVGERQIRIGDRLEGFYVQDITESGIVLTSESHSQ
ncbi:hypothetical protein [Aeoliella sp.]|uniref:hypothetical protein n=1 Tax=Aeoliella sp. TaxID=2795800 RepID=UPI003CCBBA54